MLTTVIDHSAGDGVVLQFEGSRKSKLSAKAGQTASPLEPGPLMGRLLPIAVSVLHGSNRGSPSQVRMKLQRYEE